MKHFLFALIIAVALPGSAMAERFILKNPKAPVAAQVVQKVRFGNDTYLVIEAPKLSSLMASLAKNAEAVSEDIPIGIPANERSFTTSAAGKKAWHPNALKYGQLSRESDGSGVIVAVLDTGADYTHPALKGHIYTNPGEIPGNGIDDDGNGFIDDVHGYDFDANKGDPMDRDQHGTHCAGIIGASIDVTSNAQGVAPGVKIMPVRIIGDEQKGFISNAAAGIKYAVDNGAKVLSNSWRVYTSWSAFDPSDVNLQLLRAAIEYAGKHDAIFVAASGNESINMDTGLSTDQVYPSGFDGLPNLIVVAASAQNGNMAFFSNYGASHVSVAAPGEEIISTVPGGGWQAMSGTSMATPLVAGALARGLSISMTKESAISNLINTSTQSTTWTNKVKAGGVIDLTRYLSK